MYAIRSYYEKLVKQLNAGGKLPEIAKKAGYKLRASGKFNRAGQGLQGAERIRAAAEQRGPEKDARSEVGSRMPFV